jgi:hypothetical protein
MKPIDETLALYGFCEHVCYTCGEKEMLHPLTPWNPECRACQFARDCENFGGERLANALIEICG